MHYAAIKKLHISRKWTPIPNEYQLNIPAVYEDNYIHVRGTGSDDNEVYTAVSKKITASGVIEPDNDVTYKVQHWQQTVGGGDEQNTRQKR